MKRPRPIAELRADRGSRAAAERVAGKESQHRRKAATLDPLIHRDSELSTHGVRLDGVQPRLRAIYTRMAFTSLLVWRSAGSICHTRYRHQHWHRSRI